MSEIASMTVRSAAMRRAVAGALLTLATATAMAGTPKVLPTTPPGITLVEVVLEGGVSQPVLQWVRVGDADGRTVFAYDEDAAGVSKCVDGCAQEFQPLAAGRAARAFGDWSLIDRRDGQPSVGLSIASAVHLEQGERAGPGIRGCCRDREAGTVVSLWTAPTPAVTTARLAGGALQSGCIAGACRTGSMRA